MIWWLKKLQLAGPTQGHQSVEFFKMHDQAYTDPLLDSRIEMYGCRHSMHVYHCILGTQRKLCCYVLHECKFHYIKTATILLNLNFARVRKMGLNELLFCLAFVRHASYMWYISAGLCGPCQYILSNYVHTLKQQSYDIL